MAKRTLAIVILIAVISIGCAGSATVDTGSEPGDIATAQAEPDRPTVDAVEPTAEPVFNEPTTGPPPAPTPTTGQGVGNDTDPVVMSPEAPLPALRLCTVDVEGTEELNLRQSPSLDAPIVFGIPGGSCRMRAIGAANDGWVEVVYETQNISVVGHVSTDFAAEDPQRTIALAWFDRVVAEQDTSDLAEQEFVDEWIAFHPFPPAAHRAVPFDIGLGVDCHPMDFGVTGCPVHVLDSAGQLVTPMVIQTHLVAQPTGEPEPRVIGFDLCFGTEDCEVADFLRHDRIVVDDTTSLAGVPIGTDAEAAIEALKLVFGEPTTDTEWVVGCPLDGQSERNERYVEWGSLSAGFRQFDADPNRPYFHHWTYGAFDIARGVDPAGPQPWEVRLPDGAAVGMNITEAAATTGADLFLNEVFQVQQLRRAEQWSFWGQGVETDTRIQTIGVPFIPICD